MYQYLVKLSGRAIKDHVEDPSFNREGMVAAIEAAPRQELEELWRGGVGMCTSWCIAVSHEDGRGYIYGDTGMHRACFHPADGLACRRYKHRIYHLLTPKKLSGRVTHRTHFLVD
ncbi:hypothetical protein V8E54_006306 [Elaphomyces granulatus]|jgi:hypothetical protein